MNTFLHDLSNPTVSIQTESTEELLVRRQRSVWSDVVLFELFERTKPDRNITVRHLSSMVIGGPTKGKESYILLRRIVGGLIPLSKARRWFDQ